LRGGLECLSTGRRREPSRDVAVSACDLTRELEELIAALDRRVPRVEQAGEAVIARDAAVLRAKAVDRLAELAQQSLRPNCEGQRPSDVDTAGQYAKNSVPDESI
jgi:hypothetical protein